MTYKRANFGAAIARQQRRQGYHPRGGGNSGEAASHLRDALLTRARAQGVLKTRGRRSALAAGSARGQHAAAGLG